jgi:hypothetical protein
MVGTRLINPAHTFSSGTHRKRVGLQFRITQKDIPMGTLKSIENQSGIAGVRS